MSSSEHCRRAIFQIYNIQNLKITRITTFRICNLVYQARSRWDPKCAFNFFERTLYKSNYIIFILSWCGTHTKIRNKLVDIVTVGSQNITLWGPQRTLFGILRVNKSLLGYGKSLHCTWRDKKVRTGQAWRQRRWREHFMWTVVTFIWRETLIAYPGVIFSPICCAC